MAFDKQDFKASIQMESFLKQHYPHVRTERRGRDLYVTCQFCDDNHPSCQYNEHNMKYPLYSFHCHQNGCNYDVFDLVGKMENLSPKTHFKEIVELIGQKINYPVKFSPPNLRLEAFKDEKMKLLARYHQTLLTSVEALNYLTEERQLTEQTIKSFALGLTPHNEGMTRRMAYIGNRIVFPIFETKEGPTAKCVGMGYRTIGAPVSKEIPKYKNDPNQEGGEDQDPSEAGFFIKGEYLYGYPQNAATIRKKRELFLVEGYLDVIALYQSGIHQAVSIMGVQLSDVQINLMRKLTDQLTLFLDSDNAGQKSMRKHLPRLLQAGFKVFIVDFKNGRDPADLCVSKKFDEMVIRSLIEEYRQDAVQYCLDKMISRYHTTIIPLRTEILTECEKLMEYIPDPYEREVRRRYIRHELDLM